MNELQCDSDLDCEWVEDIETENCGNLSGDDCELNPECNWNCDSVMIIWVGVLIVVMVDHMK